MRREGRTGSRAHRHGALAAGALALALGAAAAPSLAYFTTYTSAAGGRTLELVPRTEVRERYEDWTKHLTVRNTGNARCWVRADVEAPTGLPLSISSADGRWVADRQDPQVWYYTEPLEAGGEAPELTVAIGAVPQGWYQGFNVTVTEYCAPVLLDENGTPYPYSSAQVWAQEFELHTKGGA